MRPILCVMKCTRVPTDGYAVGALCQQSFDGELVHFELHCLYCSKVIRTKETLDDCLDFINAEKSVIKYIDSCDFLLQLCMEGITYPFHLTSGEP